VIEETIEEAVVIEVVVVVTRAVEEDNSIISDLRISDIWFSQ
jgi:hypothetical protein